MLAQLRTKLLKQVGFNAVIPNLYLVGFGTVLLKGLSEPESIYEFRRNVGNSDLYRKKIKIINRYKTSYSITVSRQTACMVNPVMVNNFVSLFSCTTVSRASDWMMAPSSVCFRMLAPYKGCLWPCPSWCSFSSTCSSLLCIRGFLIICVSL